MEDFNFEETEMSTSIDKLRKKKSEIDDEKPYNIIRNNLYNELNTPLNNNNKLKQLSNNNNNSNKLKQLSNNNKLNQLSNNYNLLTFIIIFIIVNNYEFHIYLTQQKFSYYMIVIIKLLLFLIINYIYKRFT